MEHLMFSRPRPCVVTVAGDIYNDEEDRSQAETIVS